MLRFTLDNVPERFKDQVYRKLNKLKAQPYDTVELKPQKHDMVIKPKQVKSAKSTKSKSSLVEVDGFKISAVHNKLWQAVKFLDGAVLELKGVIPNRRFSLDIAFPQYKIAVEVDGWEFHGKYKDSHTKDRERQNLLTLAGWRILRYTAKQINGDIGTCFSEIEQLIELVKNDREDKNAKMAKN